MDFGLRKGTRNDPLRDVECGVESELLAMWNGSVEFNLTVERLRKNIADGGDSV